MSGEETKTNVCACNVYRWRTDCKLDQFVNGPPVYKLVGPLSIIQTKVIPFINQAKQLESWLIGLEVGCKVYKQPERDESCTNLPNK